MDDMQRNWTLFISLFILFILFAAATIAIIRVFLFNSPKIPFMFKQNERTYTLHLPRSYDPSSQYMLVLALHDYSTNPSFFEADTKLNDLADKYKFIVVYPHGEAGNDDKIGWNAWICCGAAARDDHDDLGFLEALLDNLKQQYLINSHQIFVVGYGNGAMMAYRLASDQPDQIAGIGVVGGSLFARPIGESEYRSIAMPNIPVPLIAFHGLSDEVVPYVNGHSNELDRDFEGYQTSIDAWVKNNECLTERQPVSTSNYDRHIYDNCTDNAIVESYTMKKSGHIWPGGLIDTVMHPWDGNLSASQEMVDFFMNINDGTQ